MLKILFFFLLFIFSTSILAAPNLISLNLNNVDIRSALQLLTDMQHINLILTDEVQGTITLHLNQVTWDDALNLIVKTKGLTKRYIGHTLWVTTTKEILNQDKQNWQVQQQINDLAPSVTHAIPVHYAKASEILSILKEKSSGVLSEHGHILADDRSHLIWLNDTPTHFHIAQTLIRKLDVPLKQVLIEARIVNVDRSFERNLGLHFSVSKSSMKKHRQIEEEEQEKPAESGENAAMEMGAASRIAMNTMPIGMFMAKLGQNVLLDMQLAALANEGKGEYISHPKLLTQDQKTALIQAGEEIPFQEKTKNGGTSIAFKKAVLSLEVTPRVLPNRQLILDLKVNQDSPGVRLSNDIPMIDTRQIETHVQVKSGQTLVLGGILEENKRHASERVPFLSDIPLLGHLFEGNGKSSEQRELLVFITPTILDEN